MADFPILKWMQVDGRSVPFTYPQHQKGNGYVITGEDNPLPTGNHVMTESGIWVPQRGTDEGAAHTQLTGSLTEELVRYSRDVSGLGGSAQKVFQYVTADGIYTSNASNRYPIDVRGFREISVFVINNTDASISYRSSIFFIELLRGIDTELDGNNFIFKNLDTEIEIASGSVRLITKDDVGDFNLLGNTAGFIANINVENAETGSFQVVVLGGNR